MPFLLSITQPASRPHIVYILSDNLGYGNVGYIRASTPAGPSPEIVTPNLDRLASEGRVLERMYTYEMCSPSRCSLLSGRLPIHVEYRNNNQLLPGAGIPAQMTTMPAKLKAAGYATHHIGALRLQQCVRVPCPKATYFRPRSVAGKWHVGFATPAHTPLGRGFDTSLAYISAAFNGYVRTSS